MHRARTLLLTLGMMLATAAHGATAGDVGYGYGHGWGGMMMGPLVMILVLAVLVVVVVVVLRALGVGIAPAAPPPRSAIDILHDRFARGEIDKDEFEERRRVLLG
jgi:putative membrane protein